MITCSVPGDQLYIHVHMDNAKFGGRWEELEWLNDINAM